MKGMINSNKDENEEILQDLEKFFMIEKDYRNEFSEKREIELMIRSGNDELDIFMKLMKLNIVYEKNSLIIKEYENKIYNNYIFLENNSNATLRLYFEFISSVFLALLITYFGMLFGWGTTRIKFIISIICIIWGWNIVAEKRKSLKENKKNRQRFGEYKKYIILKDNKIKLK